MSGDDHPRTTVPAAELDALFHLRLLPGLGDRTLARLLLARGSATAALAAGPALLGGAAAAARGSRPILERLRRTHALVAELGVEVLVLRHPGYPAVLEQLHDPPVVLFALGKMALLERPCVAIVGSRRGTAYGADVARRLGRDLAAAGVTVISGLARGIDAAAHEGALPDTVAVLGSGIDVAYPRPNSRLQGRIAAEGLLLSEFMPGEPALRYNFPRRNRIIAALARAVVVVEAAADSGSLITVEHAISLGRDVLAVPGPVGRSTSAATNALLRDGAGVVVGADDVLDALGLARAPAPPTPGSAEAVAALESGPDPLLKALSEEPVHIDVLARACGLDSGAALGALLALELRGVARQLPGLRFARILPEQVRAATAVHTPLGAHGGRRGSAGAGGGRGGPGEQRNRHPGPGYHRP